MHSKWQVVSQRCKYLCSLDIEHKAAALYMPNEPHGMNLIA